MQRFRAKRETKAHHHTYQAPVDSRGWASRRWTCCQGTLWSCSCPMDERSSPPTQSILHPAHARSPLSPLGPGTSEGGPVAPVCCSIAFLLLRVRPSDSVTSRKLSSRTSTQDTPTPCLPLGPGTVEASPFSPFSPWTVVILPASITCPSLKCSDKTLHSSIFAETQWVPGSPRSPCCVCACVRRPRY